MKPSARRRVERQIKELMKDDGDRCSSCGTPFPHNSRSFGGITAGGDAALVGECCQNKLKEIVLSGLYIDQRFKDLALPAGEPAKPHSVADVSAAIGAMQHTFRRIEDETNKIKAKGGWVGKNASVNTAESPWKSDDARWFQQNPARAHRLRPAFPGELEGLPEATTPLPSGHEFQILLRQVQPGTRLRTAFCRNLEIPIPDIEPLMHALFDVVSASNGGAVSTEQVAELALRYASIGNGGASQN